MLRLATYIGIGVIVLISGLFYLNTYYLVPVDEEIPEVTLTASAEYEDITIKQTTYQDEKIIQPLINNLGVNLLINEDYEELSHSYDKLNFAITYRNDDLLSIVIETPTTSYPYSYSFKDDTRITLKDLFTEGAVIKNILNYPAYPIEEILPGVAFKDDGIVAYTISGQEREYSWDSIAPLIKLEYLQPINKEVYLREYARRETQKKEQLLASRIQTQQEKLSLPVDCSTTKCAALTFDDGPGYHTSRLLDILNAKNVKATFYILGVQIDKFPDEVARIDDEGHSIGNHTYNHPDLQTISADEVFAEIDKTQNKIYETSGQFPLTYRPPYGSSRSIEEFYPFDEVLWNVDTKDWQHRNIDQTLSYATSNIEDGSIILMHDIHKSTVDAVPSIIDTLRSQGFTLVTVEDLLINPPDVYQPSSQKIISQDNIIQAENW